MKKLTCIFLAVLMVLSLAGIASAEKTDKTFTFTMAGDVGDLSPFGGDSGGRHHTYRMMYDCLAASKGLGKSINELEPQIAKSWTVADSKNIDVEIFDYVKDSQGNHITASDVVYSYQQAIASGTMEKLNGYLDTIEATGEYTLHITLKSDSMGAMEWVMDTVPIVSEAWFSNASDADKTQNPAVTGPYILKETVADSHTTLVRNDDYWQTDESLRAYYDSDTFAVITLNVARESSMRTIALENRETDGAQNVNSAEVAFFMNDPAWNVQPVYNGRMNVIMFNNDNSVFADNQALRQACLYAIDADAVRLGYGYLYGAASKDFSPAVSGDYLEKWKNEDYFDYNLEKAKELMAEAGYPDGGIEVTLMYQNSTNATSGLTVLQNNLADIGVKVNLMPADQALFNSYKYDDTKWDIIVDSKATSDFATAVWENCFDTKAFTNGSACFTHDDELQRLLMEAASSATHSEETLDAFHSYLKEKAYGAGLFEFQTFYVFQSGVTETQQDGFGNMTVTGLTFADDFQTLAK
ncbi:MAG: ABC transporter substrate-binding protein [Clostridia bacterium]|nr:ABC transporter substrate-binding protein [Clostridia bacterium]